MAKPDLTGALERTERMVDSDPATSEALRRVIAAPALRLPPPPREPAALRRTMSSRGW